MLVYTTTLGSNKGDSTPYSPFNGDLVLNSTLSGTFKLFLNFHDGIDFIWAQSS